MRIDENPCCILKTIVTSLVVQWLRTDCQCRGQGFDPWPGKVHAAEQPVCFNDLACAPQERLLQWETRAPQLEGSSRWLQLEKPSCSNKDPCTARKKMNVSYIVFFFCTKSSKFGMHFILTAHPSWELPHFKYFVVTCSEWLPHWMVLLSLSLSLSVIKCSWHSILC